MAAVQQQIDFTRAEQLGLLDRAVIPPRPRVSAAAQKAVLRVIDSHGRGRVAWVGYETLSAEANLSPRSAKRAVAALVESSLVCVETRKSASGAVVNHYSVVWSEVALLTRPSARVSPPVRAADDVAAPPVREACEDRERSATVSERSATVSERSATVSERSAMVALAECHGGTQTVLPPMKRTEPPPQSPSAAGGGWDDLISEWQSRLGQIAQLARDAERRGESCEAFAARVSAAWRTATSPANAGKLAKPAGAVVYFLRTATWPCEGVIDASDERAVERTLADATRRTERRDQRERDRERDLLRLQLSRAVRRCGASGVSREHAVAWLASRVSAESLAIGGWSSVDEVIRDYWVEG